MKSTYSTRQIKASNLIASKANACFNGTETSKKAQNLAARFAGYLYQ